MSTYQPTRPGDSRLHYTGVLVAGDAAQYPLVHERLQHLIARNDQNSLRTYRDQFRRYVDYSALFFILFWGLNVVDAAVDAHLKSFDVSPDLGFRIRAGFSEMGRTNGISLILAFK